MRTERVIVFGAGGHGKVVVDALLESGVPADRLTVVDGDPALNGTRLMQFAITAPLERLPEGPCVFHIAIGDGTIRGRITAELEALGAKPLTVRHPAAFVSRSASAGPGSFVAARAVLGPDARIGRGTIVNHGAIVDHDCALGDYVHVGPNATLGGGARVGDRALIGASATILPAVSIGEGAIVGAGAVVLRDVPPGATCVGVPARLVNVAE